MVNCNVQGLNVMITMISVYCLRGCQVKWHFWQRITRSNIFMQFVNVKRWLVAVHSQGSGAPQN